MEVHTRVELIDALITAARYHRDECRGLTSPRWMVSMEQFTLEEATRWIGHTVIAKTAFHAGRAQIAAEQHGTVIGVEGEHTLQGAPVRCLAVQFWPEKQGDVPSVVFVTKRVCTEYLCLSQTVQSPGPSCTTHLSCKAGLGGSRGWESMPRTKKSQRAGSASGVAGTSTRPQPSCCTMRNVPLPRPAATRRRAAPRDRLPATPATDAGARRHTLHGSGDRGHRDHHCPLS